MGSLSGMRMLVYASWCSMQHCLETAVYGQADFNVNGLSSLVFCYLEVFVSRESLCHSEEVFLMEKFLRMRLLKMDADRVVEAKVMVNFMPEVWTFDDMGSLLATVGEFIRCDIVRNKFTGKYHVVSFPFVVADI